MSRNFPTSGLARLAVAVLLAASALIDEGVVWSQESSTYSIERLAVVSSAGQASSIRFEAALTIAQAAPAGSASSCNSGFWASLGFWSDLPVRNSLSITLSGGNEGTAVLSWSGSAALFEVYRSTSPATVLDPQNLYVSTTDCFAVDSEPSVGGIIYYVVVPAAD